MVAPGRVPSSTLRSTKGKKIWLDANLFSYRLVRVRTDGSTSVRCIVRSCSAIGVIENDAVSPGGKPHNHPPSDFPEETYTVRKFAKVYRQTLPTAESVRLAVASAPAHVAPYLPSKCALTKATARAAPNRGSSSASYPYSPVQPLFDQSGSPFCRHNSSTSGSDGFLLFATSEGLRRLEEVHAWAVDGTFRITQTPWKQCFIIGVMIGRLFVPSAFCLLQGKSARDYEDVFRTLLTHGVLSPPDTISCDFEKAISSAASKVYPAVEIRGCFFLFTQNVWRCVQREGLVRSYNSVAGKDIVRSCCALAFVPKMDLRNYYSELCGYASTTLPAFKALLDYVGRVYVGMVNGAPVTADYDPDEWNVELRILQNEPLTNSPQESCNASFCGCRAVASSRMADQQKTPLSITIANGRRVEFGAPGVAPSTQESDGMTGTREDHENQREERGAVASRRRYSAESSCHQRPPPPRKSWQNRQSSFDQRPPPRGPRPSWQIRPRVQSNPLPVQLNGSFAGNVVVNVTTNQGPRGGGVHKKTHRGTRGGQWRPPRGGQFRHPRGGHSFHPRGGHTRDSSPPQSQQTQDPTST